MSPKIVISVLLTLIVSASCDFKPRKTYESAFTDSIRAEFELGTGYVAHRKIDEYLRTGKIGFVDGTMWSGPNQGADYTELYVDLELEDLTELIDYLLDQKLISGEPTWFVNEVELKPANKSE